MHGKSQREKKGVSGARTRPPGAPDGGNGGAAVELGRTSARGVAEAAGLSQVWAPGCPPGLPPNRFRLPPPSPSSWQRGSILQLYNPALLRREKREPHRASCFELGGFSLSAEWGARPGRCCFRLAPSRGQRVARGAAGPGVRPSPGTESSGCSQVLALTRRPL